MQRGGHAMMKGGTLVGPSAGSWVPASSHALVNSSNHGAAAAAIRHSGLPVMSATSSSSSSIMSTAPACCLLGARSMTASGLEATRPASCLMMQMKGAMTSSASCLLQSRHIASMRMSPSSRLSSSSSSSSSPSSSSFIPFLSTTSSSSSSRRFLRVKTPSSSSSASSSADGESRENSSSVGAATGPLHQQQQHHHHHHHAQHKDQHQHHHQHQHQHHHQHLQGCGSSKYGTHPKCWSCDNFVNGIQLFCTTCQKVQPPSHYDFFELLGMPKKFAMDPSKLEKHYWALQRKLHPDNFHTATTRERNYSEGVSSIINEAYYTLKHPNKRARYLMQLMGVSLDESTGTIQDPELLMEVMEIRMRLEDADANELRQLESENKQRLDRCYEEIGKALDAADKAKCREVAVRLQYYVKIEEEIKKRKEVE